MGGAGIASIPQRAGSRRHLFPLWEGAVMANRSGNDDRSVGASDRERQRDVISEPSRGSSMSASSNGVSGNNGSAASRKSARGFASMDQGKQREIASKGGRAAHAKGTAHE